jgi:hypothetical protein
MSKQQLPWVLGNGTSAVIFPSGARPALELAHNFSFVLNASGLADPTPNATLTVAPGHEFRRASRAEVVAIKEMLTTYATATTWEVWQGGEKVVKGNRTGRSPLPEDQWRYFVIEFQGPNSTIIELERAFSIACFDLKIGFTLMPEIFRGKKTPMLIFHPARLFSQVQCAYNEMLPFIEVTAAVVDNLILLHKQIQTSDQRFESLTRLTGQVLGLDALPSDSPLLFLGYFAILESLITHQPKKTDTIDSITRQVKQKVLLLDNRWEPRLDYSTFPESKRDTIWSKMYEYRSCLAHGANPDFKKDLHLLGDRDRPLKLLKQTVKSVLRQAVIEPQLILDLRNC